tara:strand:+ start:92 stop:262 length:171 start_codon:yes stop_codon:yes gene_type:complete
MFKRGKNDFVRTNCKIYLVAGGKTPATRSEGNSTTREKKITKIKGGSAKKKGKISP